MMSRTAAFVSLVLLFARTASAQTAPDPDEADRRARDAIGCAERVHHQLGQTLRLLRETEAQLAHGDPQVRRDAAAAVLSLEQRLHALAGALGECAPEESEPGVRTVTREPTGAAAAVGQANDLNRVLENEHLGGHVTVLVGHRVDGHGRIAATTLRAGMRRVAPYLERCYDRLVDRGAFVEGDVTLSFWVGTRGRVRGISIDRRSLGDREFEGCLQRAARTIDFERGPTGGEAHYATTLHFGRPG